MNHRIFLICLIGLILLGVAGFAHATTEALRAVPWQNTAVFAGPSTTYAQVGWVRAGTSIQLQARNAIGTWVRMEEPVSGIEGWVILGDVTLNEDFDLSLLTPDEDIADGDPNSVNDEVLSALYTIPVLPEIDPAMCEVLAQSPNPYRVSKVGDSNSASPQYLAPVGRNDADLGPYGFLQPAQERFGPTLGNPSMAARVGMNATSVFDPFWGHPVHCESNESPLACELRLAQPGIVIVMFGINDTRVLNREGYAMQLRQLVEMTLTASSVPVLIAFSSAPEYDRYNQVLHFNLIAHQVAQDFNVPFVNFWLAAQDLPRNGIGDDLIHLTQTGARFVLGFNESRYGLTLHNMLVLHTLDRIHTTCLAEPSPTEEETAP